MPEEKNHSGRYTAEDFERYYSGGMTPAERHRLEKAALDDPFLADALEGYAQTPVPATDAAWLRSELENRMGSSKVVPIKRSGRFPLWRAAVLLVLTGGTAWAIYRYAMLSSSGNLAKARDEAIVTETADTTAGSFTITADTAVLQQPAPSPPPRKAPDVSLPAATRKVKAPETKEKTAPAAEAVTAAEVPAKKALPVARDSANLAGNVAGTELSRTTLRKTEADALFSRAETTTAPASLREEKVPAPAPASATDRRTDSNFPYGKSLVLRKKVLPASVPPGISYEGVEPDGGAKKLSNFISRNLKQPSVRDSAYRPGEVHLSFYVDEEGRATNVRIEKSFCTPCETEAVRLLREGPKWIPKDNSRKGTVRIRF